MKVDVRIHEEKLFLIVPILMFLFYIEKNRHFNELLSTTGHRLENMAGDLHTYRSSSENNRRLLEHEKGNNRILKNCPPYRSLFIFQWSAISCKVLTGMHACHI